MSTPHPTYERGSMREIVARLNDFSATMEDIYALSQSTYAWEGIEYLRAFFSSPIFMMMQIENPLWFQWEFIPFRECNPSVLSGMLVYLHESLPREVLVYSICRDHRLCAPWLVSDFKSHKAGDMARHMMRVIRDNVDHSYQSALVDDILHSGYSPKRIRSKWNLCEAVAGELRR